MFNFFKKKEILIKKQPLKQQPKKVEKIKILEVDYIVLNVVVN
jgi:hypothetical protein